MALTTEPVFIERDAEAITAEMIARYEADSGKTLYPAQAERLLIDLIAYREMLLRSAIQDAAKQNLVRYARAPMLDYLGELVGVYRLAAQSAQATLAFSVDTAPLTDVLIPAGLRISASDSVIFATDTDAVLKAGTTSITTTATCADAGTVGNGWQPAQISTLLDDVSDLLDLSVSNLTATSGGSEQEDDEKLRERIMLAPEAFSTAGSRLAYRYHALSAHPDIVDVAVVSPTPGTVELYPLMSGGLPDASVLTDVESLCSAEKVRPLTDTVTVSAPERVDYAIHAQLVIKRGESSESVKAAAETAAAAWAQARAATLGKDIVLSQIIAALSVNGVYDVSLTSPTQSLTVEEHQWAHCTGIEIVATGVSDE